MDIALMISWRYLYAKRKRLFISFITVISICGVSLGVCALIITLSVMNGFQTDLKDKIVSSNPHLVIIDSRGGKLDEYKSAGEKILKSKEILAVEPFVYGQGMLKKGKINTGVVIKGITLNESSITNIPDKIKYGNFIKEQDNNTIVIGYELAKKLDAYVGDEVVFISPELSLTSFGKAPRWKKLTVCGIVETGMYEYDAHSVYVNINTAQNVLNMGDAITGLGAKVENIYQADKIALKISKLLDNRYWIKSWLRSNSSLFAALKLEKLVMFIILVLIIIVAAFGIVSSLMLMTMDKIKDIGILKAMGMTRKTIARIFIFEGLYIGLFGTITGIIFGIGISYILDHYKFIKLPSDIYYLTTLPVNVRCSDILMIAGISMVISLLSTLYPALKASKLDPCESLRYE